MYIIILILPFQLLPKNMIQNWWGKGASQSPNTWLQFKFVCLSKSPNGLRALNSEGMQQSCEATALQVGCNWMCLKIVPHFWITTVWSIYIYLHTFTYTFIYYVSPMKRLIWARPNFRHTRAEVAAAFSYSMSIFTVAHFGRSGPLQRGVKWFLLEEAKWQRQFKDHSTIWVTRSTTFMSASWRMDLACSECNTLSICRELVRFSMATLNSMDPDDESALLRLWTHCISVASNIEFLEAYTPKMRCLNLFVRLIWWFECDFTIFHQGSWNSPPRCLHCSLGTSGTCGPTSGTSGTSEDQLDSYAFIDYHYDCRHSRL